MDINISELLSTLVTLLLGGGLGWLTKSGRIKDKADAYKKMAEAYQYRIDTLHAALDTCNKTINEGQDRIADLNHALNAKEDEKRQMEADKTKQIRNLTGKLYQSEQEVNRVQNILNEANNIIIRLTEERDDERRRADYNEIWRCEWTDCKDPRGPKPPRDKLRGLKYLPPAQVIRKPNSK